MKVMNYALKLSSIADVASSFINNIKDDKIFAFYGDMGVGKTTFISAICKELGVESNVNSPTFTIINEYITKDNNIIYHLDLYRINNIQEALNIGIEEYLQSGNLCFIEWAENIKDILPLDIVKVIISKMQSGDREIIIEK